MPDLLLVEDNAELRHYLQTILVLHYHVEIARNGAEGIEKALEMVPDVIISDVMMPVKDGFELCRTLKNNFRTNHIPIILLTARADAESKLVIGLEKGADAYMSKPFQPKELQLRLRKLIELREKLKIKYSLQQSARTPGDARRTWTRYFCGMPANVWRHILRRKTMALKIFVQIWASAGFNCTAS